LRVQSAIISTVAAMSTVTGTVTCEVSTAPGVFAPGHLGELTQQVPFDAPRAFRTAD
jgi:hypothetical protein